MACVVDVGCPILLPPLMYLHGLKHVLRFTLSGKTYTWTTNNIDRRKLIQMLSLSFTCFYYFSFFSSITYYILCTIPFLILYLHHVSFHVVATCPCYVSHFLHIVLSYIFLYDLVLSYTLHLRFHSDYRIDIHDRFEREHRPVCHSIAM